MAPLLVLLLSTPLVTCYVLDLPNSLSLVITVDPDPVTNQCYYQDFISRPGSPNVVSPLVWQNVAQMT